MSQFFGKIVFKSIFSNHFFERFVFFWRGDNLFSSINWSAKFELCVCENENKLHWKFFSSQCFNPDLLLVGHSTLLTPAESVEWNCSWSRLDFFSRPEFDPATTMGWKSKEFLVFFRLRLMMQLLKFTLGNFLFDAGN